MKLSVNKQSPRLSMSSKKALKQKKDSDVGGVKKVKLDYHFGMKNLIVSMITPLPDRAL